MVTLSCQLVLKSDLLTEGIHHSATSHTSLVKHTYVRLNQQRLNQPGALAHNEQNCVITQLMKAASKPPVHVPLSMLVPFPCMAWTVRAAGNPNCHARPLSCTRLHALQGCTAPDD